MQSAGARRQKRAAGERLDEGAEYMRSGESHA